MNCDNYKIVKKDKIDEAQDAIIDDVLKQNGFDKYYILGEINAIKILIDVLKNDDGFLYKKDLIEFIKTAFKDYDWTNNIIDAIVEKYD